MICSCVCWLSIMQLWTLRCKVPVARFWGPTLQPHACSASPTTSACVIICNWVCISICIFICICICICVCVCICICICICICFCICISVWFISGFVPLFVYRLCCLLPALYHQLHLPDSQPQNQSTLQSLQPLSVQDLRWSSYWGMTLGTLNLMRTKSNALRCLFRFSELQELGISLVSLWIKCLSCNTLYLLLHSPTVKIHK